MCVRDASPTVNLIYLLLYRTGMPGANYYCWLILETMTIIRTDITVVFCISILRISAWDQIPQFPVGRRFQYYFLHTNGNYKYGYDTGDEHTSEVSSNPIITETTSHGNSPTDGIVKQKLDSSLNFGNHQGQDASDSRGAYFVYTNTVGKNKGSDVGYTLTYNGISSGRHDDKHADEMAMGISSPQSFSYEADDHSHTEISDHSDNKDDGIRRKGDYKAEAKKVFVARGMNFQTSPSSDDNKNVQTNVKGKPPLASVATDGSYSFSFETDDHSRTEAADSNGNVRGSYSFINKDDNIRRTVTYEAGANKGFVVRQQYFPGSVQTPSIFLSNSYNCNQQKYWGNLPQRCQQVTTEPSNDNSYSFGYETPDQLRKESSDARGNVKGSYSFISKDDGIRRTIDYEAGAGKGFVATGSHLPVPPVDSSLHNTYTTTTNSLGNLKTSEGQSSDGFTDGSYSFGYKTFEGSRQESSDINGNVKGSFSFLSNDGIRRRNEYDAGAGKGFIAKGMHLPVTPEGSSLQDIYNTATDSQESAKTSEGQSSGRGLIDGSYSFGYETTNESRQESSDINGNVKGSYSFVSNDGVRRKVEYEAGADKGFVARGSHIPVPPVNSSLRSSYTTEANNLRTAETSQGQTSDGFNDGSYSFGYETSDKSRQESSDVRGNVKGSYSFISNDGVRRRIEYEAGAGKGFVARGPHLLMDSGAGIVGTLKNTYNGVSSDQTSQLGENTKKISNFVLRTFLPPNSKNKYGYIFESSH